MQKVRFGSGNKLPIPMMTHSDSYEVDNQGATGPVPTCQNTKESLERRKEKET